MLVASSDAIRIQSIAFKVGFFCCARLRTSTRPKLNIVSICDALTCNQCRCQAHRIIRVQCSREHGMEDEPRVLDLSNMSRRSYSRQGPHSGRQPPLGHPFPTLMGTVSPPHLARGMGRDTDPPHFLVFDLKMVYFDVL